VKKFSLLFFILMAAANLLNSQELLPEDEAPSYLWNWEIGDSEVDLFWEGYWKIRLMGGFGVSWNQDEFIFPTQYPGLSSFLHLEQEPDILLSLWLDNRYYLETSFINDYEKNSYAMGYKGSENQFIEHIRLSNSDLQTEGFGGISISNPQYNTPGLLVSATGNDSQHEMLFRMDGSSENQLIYQGTYLVEEDYLDLQEWEEGRYFLLPNTEPDESSLRVYLQSARGEFTGSDGLKYRRLEAGEYIVNLQEGLVSFPDPMEGNILIFYSKGAYNLGDNNLAENMIPSSLDQGFLVDPQNTLPFSWSSADPFSPSNDFSQTSLVVVDGRNCLLLKKSGHFSPFEFNNSYPLGITPSTEDWRNYVLLVNRSSGEELSGPVLSAQWNDESIRIYSSQGNPSLRSTYSRYPLIERYPLLYGPGGQQEGDHQDSQLRIYTLSSEGNFKLPSGWIKGSLNITINGKTTSDYRIDEEGVIHFTRYILPRDRIVINYRKESETFQGSEILLYQGSSFVFNKQNTLEWGLLANWTLPGDEFTEGKSNEGLIRASAQYRYETDLFQSDLQISGDLRNPDTQGLLRLAGMERDIQRVNVYPDVLQSSLNAYTELGLSSADFQLLDRYSYRNSEDQLQNYNFPSPQSTDEYGPSAALPLETDNFDIPVMILPFDLSTGEWTGASLMLSDKGEEPQDLSGLQELRFSIKWNSSDTCPDLRMILGEAGEWADHNGDDQLERSNPQSYVLRSLDEPASDGLWHHYSLVLDDVERSRLQRAMSFTLLLENTGSSSAGDLIIGDIQLAGRGFNTAVLDSGGNITEGEILAREQFDSSLQASFPEVVRKFHSSNETQRIATISWGEKVDSSSLLNVDPQLAVNLDTTDTWTAETRLATAVNSRYRKMTFYLRVDEDTPGGSYSLNFLDSTGRGIEILYTPENNDWVEIELDLVTGSLTSSGGTVSLEKMDKFQGQEWNRLVIEGSGCPSGELSIDEIHLSESILELSSQAQWMAQYLPDVSWESTQGFNYLSNIRLYSLAEGKEWSPLTEDSEREWSFNHLLEAEANILLVHLQLNLEYSLSGESNRVLGGHQLQFPYFDYPLQFSETFSMSDGQDDSYYSGERSLLLSWRSWENLNSYEVEQENDRKKQNWNILLSHDGTSALSMQWKGSAQLNSSQQGTYALYPDQYLNSWEDLIPSDRNHLSRGSSLNQEIFLDTQPLGLQSSINTQSQGSYKPQWIQGNRYSSQLKLPVKVMDKWNITPFYNRNLSWSGGQEKEEYFSSDWYYYSQDLFHLIPISHEIPLVELFKGDYEPLYDRDQRSSDRIYSASMGMNVSRPAVNSLNSLWLPVGFSAELMKEYTENGSIFSSEQYWDFIIKHQGQNLFGSFGLHPLFPFYQSGSFSSILEIRMKGQNKSWTELAFIDWDWSIDLKGSRETYMHFKNNWSLDFEEKDFTGTTGVNLGWRGVYQDYYRVPLSRQIIDRPFFMEHRSTARYSIRTYIGDSPFEKEEYTDKQECSVQQHWIMNFTDWGIIDSWIALGYSLDEDYSMAGAETGIEIRITF